MDLSFDKSAWSAATRQVRWTVGAALGGIAVVAALIVAAQRRPLPNTAQPPAVADASPPVEPTDTGADAPAPLPDFEVAAVSVLEGEATWYRVPRNSLPRRRAWPGEFTAASDRIAPGTYVRVRRIDSGGDANKAVVARITDDGVHRKNTVLDLDRRAAGALGMVKDGQAHVRVEVLALRNVTTDKPVSKKTDPPLNPKASEITDQPVATGRQERADARAKAEGQGAP